MRKDLLLRIVVGTVLAAIWGLVDRSNASLLVTESYDYALTDDANMNGVASSATGLTGNYTATLVISNGDAGQTGSATYNTTGLAFGSNFHSVSGGSVSVSATSGTTGGHASNEYLDVTISASATGTVYSSFLASFTSSNGSGFALSNGFSAGDNFMGGLQVRPKTTGGQQVAVGMGSVTNGTSIDYTAGTTYLFLARYTNVGNDLSLGDGVSDLWVFDLTAYDNWFAAGADESALSTYALATATQTLSSGTFNLNGLMSTAIHTGGLQNLTISGIYDEYYIGTTLADVTAMPIPEPTALGLLAVGQVLVVLHRRRTSRRC